VSQRLWTLRRAGSPCWTQLGLFQRRGLLGGVPTHFQKPQRTRKEGPPTHLGAFCPYCAPPLGKKKECCAAAADLVESKPASPVASPTARRPPTRWRRPRCSSLPFARCLRAAVGECPADFRLLPFPPSHCWNLGRRPHVLRRRLGGAGQGAPPCLLRGAIGPRLESVRRTSVYSRFLQVTVGH